MSDSSLFYEHLPAFDDFALFHQASWYQALPSDWCILVTDVLGSTQAIEQGKYKQVNAMGVASIVAINNALSPLKIPYVFGGDGASACIPISMLKEVKPALLACEKMASEKFDLTLRLGLVYMSELSDQGKTLLVGKYQPHDDYQQAMFLGDGLAYAESLIKDPAKDNPFLIKQGPYSNHKIFEGFECRWNEIPSPKQENISLLVQALDKNQDKNERIFTQVLNLVTDIYGNDESHHPLTEDKLSLTLSRRLLSIEAGIRTAFLSRWQRIKYTSRLWFMAWVGKYLMGRKVQTQQTNWGAYKHNLILNTDYRKFDDVLRMVISGSAQQQIMLRAALQKMHDNADIAFGIHSAPSSLITCVVTDYNKDHVHFLDGANGGYAMAAKELKQQLKQAAPQA